VFRQLIKESDIDRLKWQALVVVLMMMMMMMIVQTWKAFLHQSSHSSDWLGSSAPK